MYSEVPDAGGTETGEPQTLRFHSAIAQTSVRAEKGGWVWEGGEGVRSGSLPREVASVGHKMQHGSCLTPKTEAEI